MADGTVQSAVSPDVAQTFLEKLVQFQSSLSVDEKAAFAELWSHAADVKQEDGEVSGYNYGYPFSFYNSGGSIISDNGGGFNFGFSGFHF